MGDSKAKGTSKSNPIRTKNDFKSRDFSLDDKDDDDDDDLFRGFTAPVNASKTNTTKKVANGSSTSIGSGSGRAALRGIQDLSSSTLGPGLGMGLKPGQTIRVKAGGHKGKSVANAGRK